MSAATPPPPPVLEVERYGIEPIKREDQTSTPFDLFRITFGGANTFATIILGTLPIAFGLSFWAAASATVVGVVVGGLVLAPMALFGPRNHTNNAVSSGAHFGVRGRIVGSFLSLLTAIAFFSISVWVSGDAIVGAAQRLLDISGGNVLRAVAYGVIALAVLAVCIYGYQFMLAVNKVAVIAATVMMLLGVVAYASSFSFSFPGTGTYALGTFWPTWMLAVLTVVSNPISFGAFLGDWGRYIPDTYRPVQLMAAPFLAQLATLVPFLFGVATATLVADPANYIGGLAAISPLWYAIPLMIVALIGGLSTGVTSLYGTGLDFSSIFPRLSRVQATLLIGTLSVLFIFIGNFVFNIVSSINAFAVLIVICTSPWMVIMMIGWLVRRGFYSPDDLQVFNRGQRGGLYWFADGLNWRALAAWVSSAVVGLCLANTPLIAGPLRNLAGGIDLSLVVTMLMAGVVYLVLLFVSPERRSVFGPDGPRWVPTSDRPATPITAG